MKIIPIISLTAALTISGAVGILAAPGHSDAASDDQGDDHGAQVTRLLMPIMNANRGMEVFASKGCASCHSVNGVGGQDASSLDAHDMDEYMNPFDLAAKMWLMAPYMIAAQEDEMGEQIVFTGDELSNIIAFLHDDAQQKLFTEEFLEIFSVDAPKHSEGGGAHDDGEDAHGEVEMMMAVHDDNEEPHDEVEVEAVHDDNEEPHD